MTTMTQDGDVEIGKDALAARCHHCGKYILFHRAIHPELWNEIIKAFVAKHRTCSSAR